MDMLKRGLFMPDIPNNLVETVIRVDFVNPLGIGEDVPKGLEKNHPAILSNKRAGQSQRKRSKNFRT